MRLKSFPIELKFELNLTTINEINKTSTNILTPELIPINSPLINETFFKDLLEFPKPGLFQINSFYRNLLFIYPKFVNLTSKSAANARNISIKIELMNANKKQSLFWIFGGPRQPNFISAYSTTVSYHTK